MKKYIINVLLASFETFIYWYQWIYSPLIRYYRQSIPFIISKLTQVLSMADFTSGNGTPTSLVVSRRTGNRFISFLYSYHFR